MMNRFSRLNPLTSSWWGLLRVPRFMRMILVTFCLPLAVVVNQTGAANAAVAYGSVERWSVTGEHQDGSGDSGWNFICSGSGAYKADGASYSVMGKVLCRVDVFLWNDPAPGDLTSPTLSIGYQGTEIDGTPCTYTMGPLTGDPLVSQSYETAPTPTECRADQVCVEAYAVDPGFSARFDSYQIDRECVNISMGDLPASIGAEGTCSVGNPSGASARWIKLPDDGTATDKYQLRISGTYPPGTGPATGEGPTTRGWNFAYWLMPEETPTTPNEGGNPSKQWSTIDGTAYKIEAEARIKPSVAPTDQVYGVEMYWMDFNDPTVTWNRPSSGRNYTTPSGRRATEVPSGAGSSYGGITDPGRCRFWFGQKLVDIPDTDVDEPYMAVNEIPTLDPPDLDPEPPPETESSSCDFSFTDPSTWATAGICQLVKMMQSLISTVANLPGKIADLIVAGVKGLFVPTQPFSKFVTDVEGDFDDVFPFNTAGTLDDLSTPGGTGGCPDWDVRLPGIGGAAGKEYSVVCDSSFVTAIRGARPFLLAGMLAVAFWPLMRGIFYASLPLLKPTPSGGEK